MPTLSLLQFVDWVFVFAGIELKWRCLHLKPKTEALLFVSGGRSAMPFASPEEQSKMGEAQITESYFARSTNLLLDGLCVGRTMNFVELVDGAVHRFVSLSTSAQDD